MAAAPSLLDWLQHPHNWVVPKLYAEPPPHTHPATENRLRRVFEVSQGNAVPRLQWPRVITLEQRRRH